MKLATLRRYALSLPDVTEQPHHEFGSWRVHGRIFATIPPAGDAIHVFLGDDDRERALAMYPAWTEKLMWGGKARGVRLLLGTAELSAAKRLLSRAHAAKAG